VVEVVLVLLTVVAVTAAMAMAPGRWRARAAARRAGPRAAFRRAPRRPPGGARTAFLAVCSSCLDMVETDQALSSCPSCGAELAVRRRIQTASRRPRTPAAR
jgi:hypothetical protein